mmetsp:Transcript_36053/g.111565  ORF Transcript_36053/g.111565 Transcript_36053/m.111565 type:complete len:202 (+) Transcript_36053:520-1125(+)
MRGARGVWICAQERAAPRPDAVRARRPARPELRAARGRRGRRPLPRGECGNGKIRHAADDDVPPLRALGALEVPAADRGDATRGLRLWPHASSTMVRQHARLLDAALPRLCVSRRPREARRLRGGQAGPVPARGHSSERPRRAREVRAVRLGRRRRRADGEPPRRPRRALVPQVLVHPARLRRPGGRRRAGERGREVTLFF